MQTRYGDTLRFYWESMRFPADPPSTHLLRAKEPSAYALRFGSRRDYMQHPGSDPCRRNSVPQVESSKEPVQKRDTIAFTA